LRKLKIEVTSKYGFAFKMIATPLLPPPASGGGVRKGIIIGQGNDTDIQPPTPFVKGE